MNKPSEIDMAYTREVIACSQTAYFDAMATHHARVAQVAIDMQRLAMYSTDPMTPETAACMAQMAAVIEMSFAHAFGVSLRPPKKVDAK